MAKNILSIVLVVFFALIAGFSLLHKGLPPTHDGEYHVVRFYEFDKALKDGIMYPRWAPDFNKGFGIPLFNYVYPLPNYLASFLHLFGISFINAFKLEMFLATILGGVFFYLWIREFWGNLGGIVSSVFYTFSPYHFLDIYVRGSVGEVLSLALFPAFLWLVTIFIAQRKKLFLLLSSFFLALLIFSHNILALMFFPFVLTYVGFLIMNNKNKKNKFSDKQELIRDTLYIMLIGLGLSSVFWLPALFEQEYVTGLKIFDVSSHFPELYQLIIPSWGSGFSGGGILSSQMSFQIGIANFLAVLLSAVVAIFLLLKKDKNARIIIFFIIWFCLNFTLMLKISLMIWKNFPLMTFFQFPWRFLSLEIIVASFLSGSIVYFWKSKILTLILIAISVFLGLNYSRPAYYLYRDDSFYITKPNFIEGTNSPANVFNTAWMNYKIDKQKEKMVLIKGKGKIEKRSEKSTLYLFDTLLKTDSEILLNIAYFPGWTIKVDGKKVDIAKTKDGLISFSASKGLHHIKVQFEDTTIRKIAGAISLLTLFIFFALSVREFFATIRK